MIWTISMNLAFVNWCALSMLYSKLHASQCRLHDTQPTIHIISPKRLYSSLLLFWDTQDLMESSLRTFKIQTRFLESLLQRVLESCLTFATTKNSPKKRKLSVATNFSHRNDVLIIFWSLIYSDIYGDDEDKQVHIWRVIKDRVKSEWRGLHDGRGQPLRPMNTC